jgi:hypothetical protein
MSSALINCMALNSNFAARLILLACLEWEAGDVPHVVCDFRVYDSVVRQRLVIHAVVVQESYDTAFPTRVVWNQPQHNNTLYLRDLEFGPQREGDLHPVPRLTHDGGVKTSVVECATGVA